jgi:hypothetical protein
MMCGIAKSECIATASIIALLSIQLISGHANANLYTFDRDVYEQVPADTLFNIFTKPFEHSVDIDADQIFPNETLKREIISKSGSYEFAMPTLNYELLGFNISASDIKVNANAKQVIDDGSNTGEKTRIDFPVMLARSVNVSNGVISQKYDNVDLSSIYAIYNPQTDKFTFHVPFELAARYLLDGS